MSRQTDPNFGRDMNSRDRSLTSLLDEYAEELRAGQPSAELNSRMEESITAWAEEHRSRDVFRRPWLWVAAAASIAVITGGIALLALGQRGRDPQTAPSLASASQQFPVVPTSGAVSTLANGGQVSLYPAEGAVFRVKANLTSATMRTGQDKTGSEEGDRQYWVDVRISNDGTMRIMQVLPAERGRVVPYE
jgi:anti-sigma-K factor RskA